MARSLPDPTDVPPLVDSMATLGRHVRNARALQRLRIDDAAALCGVSSAVFSRLENGRAVNLDKLMAVLDGLGLALLVLPRESSAVVAATEVEHLSQPDDREKPARHGRGQR